MSTSIPDSAPSLTDLHANTRPATELIIPGGKAKTKSKPTKLKPLGAKPKTGKTANTLDDYDVDEEMAKYKAMADEDDLGLARLNDDMAAILNVAQDGDFNLKLLNDAFEGKSNRNKDKYASREVRTGEMRSKTGQKKAP